MQERPGAKVVVDKTSVVEESMEARMTAVMQGSVGTKVVATKTNAVQERPGATVVAKNTTAMQETVEARKTSVVHA